MDASEKKRKAAQASLEFVEPGVTLGVGTGSTVNELIELLPTVGERIDKLVSSSRDTTERLRQKGFDVSTLNEAGDVDVYIDGADEATKRLHLIKGGGGALTRVWREGFVTDNGNHILDVHDLNISNPLEMETRLNQIPGIITVGLFAHRPADILLIADDTGVRELRN